MRCMGAMARAQPRPGLMASMKVHDQTELRSAIHIRYARREHPVRTTNMAEVFPT